MDEGESDEIKRKKITDLHFKAVNTRNEKSADENKELLSGIRKPKFIVVPAQLSSPTTQSESIGPSEAGLHPSSTSPAAIGLPAIITPTRPRLFIADSELEQASSSPNVINPSHNSIHKHYHSTYTGATGNQLFNPLLLRSGSYLFQDDGTTKLITDASSIRSLTSIGMGCTDGRKMIIKRVPNSPTELFGMVQQPPTPPEDPFEVESYDFSEDTDTLKPRRQHWENKMHFVLACIGYSVGLGNVWRFPYLCYKSGGGIFLIPYFIILFICGMPMLFMELAIGQYTGRGPIGALGQVCPLFKGAGLASVVISFFMSTYYSVIIAYAIYYFFTSFKPELPWTDCSIRWATTDCWNPTMVHSNISKPVSSRAPTEEFFENKVLQISGGIEEAGKIRWELVACLVCAWILVYFAIWKSIKSSTKARYLTATLPFILIVVFLGRALTLDGADIGLKYFFKPNWALLKDSNVWINAASQNFNSIGITFGSMISFASYNKYNNNMLHDTIAVSFVNAITCLLVGIFAFATLGNLALEQATSVENVVSDGPGLIFVVYTQALAKMPAPQMWAVMFFFMLLCLGLNSQFAIVEVVVTSIQDGFPHWIRRKLVYHELLVLIICCISFFFGLPNIVQGGMFFFQLIDHYAASVTVIFLAFFEIVAISWFFGVHRLSKAIKQMTGRSPSLYFRSCWCVFVPILLLGIFVFSLYNYKSPTYHNGTYHYPPWAQGIGWSIVALALMCIPCYAMIMIVRAEGNGFLEKIKNTLSPHIYECKICGEHHCDHIEEGLIHQEMAPMVPSSPELSPPIIVLHSSSKDNLPDQVSNTKRTIHYEKQSNEMLNK